MAGILVYDFCRKESKDKIKTLDKSSSRRKQKNKQKKIDLKVLAYTHKALDMPSNFLG